MKLKEMELVNANVLIRIEPGAKPSRLHNDIVDSGYVWAEIVMAPISRFKVGDSVLVWHGLNSFNLEDSEGEFAFITDKAVEAVRIKP